MEDHLKNKDRLEKEWEALCAYQAEPNACTIGMKDGNAKKNRSTAVVACKQYIFPYHALSQPRSVGELYNEPRYSVSLIMKTVTEVRKISKSVKNQKKS